MSVEVKGVSSIVQDVARIKEKAGDVAQRLKDNIEATDQALDMTTELSDALGQASAELRGILGVSTNNPPPEQRLEDGSGGRLPDGSDKEPED